MLMLFIAFFSLNTFAESPNPPRAGRFEGRGTFSYFSTEANFGGDGSKDLINDGSFTNMTGQLDLTYDWRPEWRFSLGTNFSYVESDNGLFSRDNSGMNEVLASAQNWYELGPFDIVPALDFVFPLWRVDEASDEALIGEGALRLRAGSWIFYPQGTIHPFAYLGFEYRDGGRAYLMPYEAGVKLKWSNFYVQGEFRGFETVADDADSENVPVREDYLNTVNGGSQHFYPINPSHGEGAVEGGIRFGSWTAFAGFAMSVFGDNYSDGWTGYGGIAFSPLGHRSKRVIQDNFEMRNEKYDQNLFEGDSRTEPQFVPREEVAPLHAPVQPVPKAAPKAPPASKPVDIQVELRRVPPKKKADLKKRNKKKLDKMMNDAESALEKK